MYESDTIEWKSEFIRELRKTFVAFANSDGGTVLIGVDDTGSPIGLDDPDAVLQQVVNCIRDNVRPDLAQFFKCRIEDIDGKAIVSVTISRGSRRPYYLADKGIRPEGVFIRKGSETVQANEDQILEFIAETNGQEFELQTSLEQNLTFEYADKVFDAHQLDFSDEKKKTMRLMTLDGFYTNLGLLVSDQCSFSIKMAHFSRDTATGEEVFVERAEVAGSVLKVLNVCDDWLKAHNRVGSTFSGMRRIDHFDFPTKALREVLLNAIVHREYALSGPILVNLFADKLEVISIGGLVRGLCLEDMFNGVSRPRNTYLAGLFAKLRFVEGWGSGIRNIRLAYQANSAKPEFHTGPHSFKVVLPMLDVQAVNSGLKQPLSAAAQSVFNALQSSQDRTREELQEELGLSSSSVVKALKELLDNGLIVKKRAGRKFVYRLLGREE